MATVISDGAAEDMLRAVQQLVCAEGHLKTLVEKYNAELEHGLIDVTDTAVREAHMEKLNDVIEELGQTSELRRQMMLQLMEQYEGDKDYWCLVKHLSAAAYCAFEAYQATDDAGMLNHALSANARLTKAITRWLGTEITDCAACLSDILRGKGES